MSGAIRIAVIDDHPMFREGAVQTFASVDDIEVVAEGATAVDALRVAEELRPDVMLLDIGLPGGGLEAAAIIAGTFPRVRAVMLTASESDVAAALRVGARGCILKKSTGAEVVETVRAIFSGEPHVVPRPAAQPAIEMGMHAEDAARSLRNGLTSREEAILSFVSLGMTNKEVASRLGLTERSVKYHMTSIMRKSKVRNRVEAMLMFRRTAGA
ncbi:MAG TPA: response regulator transcription factor [Xanthobacteraceae bacterium]|jgi:DNA-binding NarL/FixJ family response regulator|nr:response regulator transcription factor [Xanthobacteraceae bacterium]